MASVRKVKLPDEVMAYFRRTGAAGGRARARRHTPEELSAWGRMGGRPQKDGGRKSARYRKGGG